MVNLRTVERDQLLLMSSSDWLPPDHLAWFIVDVAAELDLSGFYPSLRTDGRGGASYDPGVALDVLLYSYCAGERSSRRIVQRLCEYVAFRVIAANQQPDHATLARFRHRH
ncbi:MAG: transposase [Actinobacteria bacterium]|nr:transposase [Actinomycetota bacterium]